MNSGRTLGFAGSGEHAFGPVADRAVWATPTARNLRTGLGLAAWPA